MDLGDRRPRMRDGYVLAARLFLAWGRTEPSARTEEHVRALHFVKREPGVVLMLTMYAKNEKTNIPGHLLAKIQMRPSKHINTAVYGLVGARRPSEAGK